MGNSITYLGKSLNTEQSLDEFEFSKWLDEQDFTTCKHESTYNDFCLICKKFFLNMNK